MSGDPALAGPSPLGSVVRSSPVAKRPNVPFWALVAGIVLVLVFAGLVVQTYADRSLVGALAALVPGSPSAHLADADRARVLYLPGSTVQIGQSGIGVRGQDRAFQAGDVVLLGATGQLVRLEEGNRLTGLQAPEAARLPPLGMAEDAILLTNLGAWDPARGRLAGLTARYALGHDAGGWSIQEPDLPSVGASLHVPGAPEEGLTDDFQLVPSAGGRVRRSTTPDGPTVRLRPNGRMAALQIEGRDPLPALDDVTVTVQATVRAVDGANVELALSDVLDAAGTVQKTADRRTATNEDEWITLRVQRRVTFGSPSDRYSVGLVEVRNRDWLEIRELDVYLGALP